jgi:hypothetical protein
MFRRDFLKAFGAAAAALAGGGTAVASLPKAKAAPPAATDGYSSVDQTAELVRLARQTRCISISRLHTVDGVAYYTTVHLDESDKFGANLNAEAWAMLDAAKAKPRSVSMSYEEDSIDVTDIGEVGLTKTFMVSRPVRTIEIEWVALA